MLPKKGFAMKKIVALLLSLLFVFASFSSVFAGNVTGKAPAADEEASTVREVYSGSCGANGDNLTWSLDTNTGILTISGSGEMRGFAGSDYYNNRPGWFQYQSLIRSVVIEEGVTTISSHAFTECKCFTSASVPSTVTDISYLAFDRCLSFICFSVSENNPVFSSSGGVLFSKDMTTLVLCPRGLTGAYQIPYSVHCISMYAFTYCQSLSSISIPSSVTSICMGAFAYCTALKSIHIPDSVINIEMTTFSDCSSLASVVLPSNLASIDDLAFYKCNSLTSVTIPESVETVGMGAFYECSSLNSAIFLGDPPTSFEISVFDACSADFHIEYLSKYANIWDPDNTGKWNGYPVKSTDYCIVRFIVNNSVYHTTAVKAGDYVEAPNLLQLNNGHYYNLLGWSTNPGGKGERWFNVYNNYRGKPIHSDMDFYLTQSGSVMYPGIDWYNFSNSDDDFWAYTEITQRRSSLLSIEGLAYFSMLAGNNSMSQAEKVEYVDTIFQSRWAGSCFGMSCAAAMIKAGLIDPGFFQQSAESTHALSAPLLSYDRSNKNAVAGLIEFYQTLQIIGKTAAASNNFNGTSDSENSQNLLAALDSSYYPVVLGLSVHANSDNSKLFSHAVVAHGYETTDSEYIVSILDPNFSNTDKHLHIEKGTFKNLGFDVNEYDFQYNVDGKPIPVHSFIESVFTIESGSYSYINWQDYLVGKGFTSAYKGGDVSLFMDESAASCTLTTNFNSFTIENTNGDSAVVVGGYKTEGELEISDGDCLNDMGFELSLEFDVPALAEGESYIITPAESTSIVTGEELEQYSTTLSNGADEGFTSSVSVGECIPVTIGYGGTVTTSSENVSAQSVMVSRDDMAGSWFLTEIVSDSAAGLCVSPSADGVGIIAADDAEFGVTVRSFYNEVGFENIHGGEYGVTVTEDEEHNAVIIYNENEEIAASELFGHSVIFCAMGADAIDAQNGIPTGGFALQPEDPVREGLIFGGWYSTYECENGSEWSFDTPITSDVTLYAKWIVNDDYTHLVTFRIDGCSDESYLVIDGEALTDYDLPDIPDREGHTAAWPEFDLSCVTEDMVIEAVFTPIPYPVTFLDWDGEVLDMQIVDYGTAASAPSDPYRHGYRFIGWDTDYSLILGETVITALYEKIIYGDTDCSGEVDFSDASLLTSYLLNYLPLSPKALENADANDDGTVNILDVPAICSITLGNATPLARRGFPPLRLPGAFPQTPAFAKGCSASAINTAYASAAPI